MKQKPDVQFAIAKMSTKGQIVIPKQMRTTFKDGEAFLFIRSQDRLVLRPLTKLSEKAIDDMKFSALIEEAYREYDKGNFKSMPAAKFLKEMKKW